MVLSCLPYLYFFPEETTLWFNQYFLPFLKRRGFIPIPNLEERRIVKRKKDMYKRDIKDRGRERKKICLMYISQDKVEERGRHCMYTVYQERIREGRNVLIPKEKSSRKMRAKGICIMYIPIEDNQKRGVRDMYILCRGCAIWPP